ncbi:hypothetical protein [Thermaerobacter subterraneus]|uniref:hypothetical protein n=1 Tax=Thermaerobacter subterraneus TaxID=175696 RepID=UPI0001EB4F26|nr:hypothetical protein [Thermaerobacter subterraneus]
MPGRGRLTFSKTSDFEGQRHYQHGLLGYIATTNGVPFEEIATSGAGVAFVAFPKGISLLPMPYWAQVIFGLMFFFALLVAGISSSLSMFEAFASALIDRTGADRKNLLRKLALVGFLVSSLYTTGAGVHILDIVDHFVSSYGIAVLGLLEAVVLGWLYGTEKIRAHVNPLSDFPVGRWWDVLVKYVTPVLLGYNILNNLIREFQQPYGGYPQSAVLVFG